jgi:hypothetical protein
MALSFYDEQRARVRQKQQEKYDKMGLYFTTRSAMGIPWWTWYWMIGARGRGKSFSAIETVLQYVRKYGQENVKCYYMRISDASVKAMLNDNARKAIDAVLVRKYGLDLSVHGYSVYNHGTPFIDFYPLVSAAKKGKGVAEYDPDFLMKQPEGVRRYVFILIDEFMTDETQEKKSVGNPYKQFRIYVENILRDQAQLDYRAVMCMGCANNVSECNEFLAQLAGFIPSEVGRYKLKRKHMLIDLIPNSKAYLEKRRQSIGADIMDYDEDENYTNIVKQDMEQIRDKHKPLKKVSAIIKFSKDSKEWFTEWDGFIIRRYTGQPFKPEQALPMRRYLDSVFDADRVLNVFEKHDAKAYQYNDLMTKALFQAYMKSLRAR